MKWEKKEIPQELVKDLAAKYGCGLITASILARRGFVRGEEIRYFLEADPGHLHNPFALPGMEDAVDRILAAKEEGEKVLVFGDRDVDGITSTVLLASFLSRLGLDLTWRLPVRDEPYGLSMDAVETFAREGGALIITVDCGISNIAEIDRAGELNIDVIITDHHNPQEELPRALAVVNPKLSDSAYPFRELCGCGVVYKLVSALRFALKTELYGQSLCLLNCRPASGAYTIEIAKMRNLAVTDTLFETVVPGMVKITETRLPRFLEGQQIFVWDAKLQTSLLSKVFGSAVEVRMMDAAPEIGKEIPHAAGKTLVRLRELSKIAKYSSEDIQELDVFINLFTSFIRRRERLFTADDSMDLQLAALGTIADIMPLKDENRIIVRHGLAALREKPRAGVSDLLFKLNLTGRRLGTGDISWQVCPAVNAAGRMGSPDKAAFLFLEQDMVKRDRLADELIAMNEERKRLGAEAWAIIEPMAEESLETYCGKLALAYGEGIYRGVTGLMANRMVGRFKVPCIAVSFGERVCTGSARSIYGYDLSPLLEQAADLFIDWGGHDFAAGFSLERKDWEAFLERLKTISRLIEVPDAPEEILRVDAELPPAYLTPDIFKVIDHFEPYGEGNKPLLFMSRDLRVAEITFMGKNEAKHVKLTVDTGAHRWSGVYWEAAEKVRAGFKPNDKVDMVFKITRNWYNHVETPQLIIIDLKPAGQPQPQP
ncbi:MAG: single-stranded-DNA-specific exonuclease RecJ [Spirochaetaceae bacterium]|jgi:single-stranded-DNA-specific exonuclease|nr:single-stranded-DNA-specific exonuclease RecJ [Spirochaetaceae bacterium]